MVQDNSFNYGGAPSLSGLASASGYKWWEEEEEEEEVPEVPVQAPVANAGSTVAPGTTGNGQGSPVNSMGFIEMPKLHSPEKGTQASEESLLKQALLDRFGTFSIPQEQLVPFMQEWNASRGNVPKAAPQIGNFVPEGGGYHGEITDEYWANYPEKYKGNSYEWQKHQREQAGISDQRSDANEFGMAGSVGFYEGGGMSNMGTVAPEVKDQLTEEARRKWEAASGDSAMAQGQTAGASGVDTYGEAAGGDAAMAQGQTLAPDVNPIGAAGGGKHVQAGMVEGTNIFQDDRQHTSLNTTGETDEYKLADDPNEPRPIEKFWNYVKPSFESELEKKEKEEKGAAEYVDRLSKLDLEDTIVDEEGKPPTASLEGKNEEAEKIATQARAAQASGRYDNTVSTQIHNSIQQSLGTDLSDPRNMQALMNTLELPLVLPEGYRLGEDGMPMPYQEIPYPDGTTSKRLSLEEEAQMRQTWEARKLGAGALKQAIIDNPGIQRDLAGFQSQIDQIEEAGSQERETLELKNQMRLDEAARTTMSPVQGLIMVENQVKGYTNSINTGIKALIESGDYEKINTALAAPLPPPPPGIRYDSDEGEFIQMEGFQGREMTEETMRWMSHAKQAYQDQERAQILVDAQRSSDMQYAAIERREEEESEKFRTAMMTGDVSTAEQANALLQVAQAEKVRADSKIEGLRAFGELVQNPMLLAHAKESGWLGQVSSTLGISVPDKLIPTWDGTVPNVSRYTQMTQYEKAFVQQKWMADTGGNIMDFTNAIRATTPAEMRVMNYGIHSA